MTNKRYRGSKSLIIYSKFKKKKKKETLTVLGRSEEQLKFPGIFLSLIK